MKTLTFAGSYRDCLSPVTVRNPSGWTYSLTPLLTELLLAHNYSCSPIATCSYLSLLMISELIVPLAEMAPVPSYPFSHLVIPLRMATLVPNQPLAHNYSCSHLCELIIILAPGCLFPHNPSCSVRRDSLHAPPSSPLVQSWLSVCQLSHGGRSSDRRNNSLLIATLVPRSPPAHNYSCSWYLSS